MPGYWGVNASVAARRNNLEGHDHELHRALVAYHVHVATPGVYEITSCREPAGHAVRIVPEVDRGCS
jgi:hypothetical protein